MARCHARAAPEPFPDRHVMITVPGRAASLGWHKALIPGGLNRARTVEDHARRGPHTAGAFQRPQSKFRPSRRSRLPVRPPAAVVTASPSVSSSMGTPFSPTKYHAGAPSSSLRAEMKQKRGRFGTPVNTLTWLINQRSRPPQAADQLTATVAVQYLRTDRRPRWC